MAFTPAEGVGDFISYSDNIRVYDMANDLESLLEVEQTLDPSKDSETLLMRIKTPEAIYSYARGFGHVGWPESTIAFSDESQAYAQANSMIQTFGAANVTMNPFSWDTRWDGLDITSAPSDQDQTDIRMTQSVGEIISDSEIQGDVVITGNYNFNQ